MDFVLEHLYLFVLAVALIGFSGSIFRVLHEIRVWLGASKRTEQLKEIAKEFGISFVPKRTDCPPTVMQFRLFQKGDFEAIGDMLQGKSGDAKLAVFDYHYSVTTSGGESSSTKHYRQSVLYMHAPSLELPGFTLVPERLTHKVGSAVGYQDIDFGSHPIFSKKYLLQGRDEPAIRALFYGEVANFFETQSKVSVECLGDSFIVYRKGKRMEPESVREFINDGFRLLSLFRKYEPPATEDGNKTLDTSDTTTDDQ